MTETVKKEPAKKKLTPEEEYFNMRKDKVRKAFTKRKVKLIPRMKHDSKRASMMEPVEFDPDTCKSIEDLDRLWSRHVNNSYPIEKEVEITQYAYNQFEKAYVGVRKAGSIDEQDGRHESDSIQKVDRFIIQDVKD